MYAKAFGIRKLPLILRIFTIGSFIGACSFLLQDARFFPSVGHTMAPGNVSKKLPVKTSTVTHGARLRTPEWSTMLTSTKSYRDDPIKIMESTNFGEDQNDCPGVSEASWSRQPSEQANFSGLQCHLLLNISENGVHDSYTNLFEAAANWTVPDPHTDSSILDLLKNCSNFLAEVDFPSSPGSKEEADFPLAYVLMAHRNAAQTVRLFRMLYQPQNAYCITYDIKSERDYKNAIIRLASCFPRNVFLNPNPEPIHYFGYSILHSAMECMTVLANTSIPWRYVQVVSWNDFPLKTNWEMVQIFKALNGSQDSELMQMNTPEHYVYQNGEHGGVRRSLAPGNIIMYKGSFANSLTREFVDFMLNGPSSVEFYQWLHDAKGPEEFYWPTLIHNLQLNPPGGFPGECEPYYTSAGSKKPFLSRFQAWDWESNEKPCKGNYVNWSCVYGIGDLAMLLKRQELIAHKVYEEFQPALSRCLEEWFWNRTCMGNTGRDFQYYERLPSVLYHRLSKRAKARYVCA